eukprot:gnl/Chilomastix_cuspidata/2051.p1 GENE.gnl/Chilomastix_cuspidata/2051~~gnl/Chilomastix_cuspidata/2051.p1  ORF type:complete len:696 (-),score=130.73 gnl/Chilomastix_cuspidata/2051:156-2243(-)
MAPAPSKNVKLLKQEFAYDVFLKIVVAIQHNDVICFPMLFDNGSKKLLTDAFKNRNLKNELRRLFDSSLGKSLENPTAYLNACFYLIYTDRFWFVDLDYTCAQGELMPGRIDEMAKNFEPRRKEELENDWKSVLLSRKSNIREFIGTFNEGTAKEFFESLGFASVPLIVFVRSAPQLQEILKKELPRNALFVLTDLAERLEVPRGARLRKAVPNYAADLLNLMEFLDKKCVDDIPGLLNEVCGEDLPGELSCLLGIPRRASGTPKRRWRLNNVVFWMLNKSKAGAEETLSVRLCEPARRKIPSKTGVLRDEVILDGMFDDWVDGRGQGSEPMGVRGVVARNLNNLSQGRTDEVCDKFKKLFKALLLTAFLARERGATGLLLEDSLLCTSWLYPLVRLSRGIPKLPSWTRSKVRVPREWLSDGMLALLGNPNDKFLHLEFIMHTEPPEILKRPLANLESMCKVGEDLEKTLRPFFNELSEKWPNYAAVEGGATAAVTGAARETGEHIAYKQVRHVLESEERRAELRKNIEINVSRSLEDSRSVVGAAAGAIICDRIFAYLEAKYPPIMLPDEAPRFGIFQNSKDAPGTDLFIFAALCNGEVCVPYRVGIDCKRSDAQPTKPNKGKDFSVYADQQDKAKNIGLDLLVSFRLTKYGPEISDNIPAPSGIGAIPHIGAGREVISRLVLLFFDALAFRDK